MLDVFALIGIFTVLIGVVCGAFKIAGWVERVHKMLKEWEANKEAKRPRGATMP